MVRSSASESADCEALCPPACDCCLIWGAGRKNARTLIASAVQNHGVCRIGGVELSFVAGWVSVVCVSVLLDGGPGVCARTGAVGACSCGGGESERNLFGIEATAVMNAVTDTREGTGDLDTRVVTTAVPTSIGAVTRTRMGVADFRECILGDLDAAP